MGPTLSPRNVFSSEKDRRDRNEREWSWSYRAGEPRDQELRLQGKIMDVCDVAVELAAGEVVLENLRGGGEG